MSGDGKALTIRLPAVEIFGVDLDNAKIDHAHALKRACCALNIRVLHRGVGDPPPGGLVERFFRTTQDQLEAELRAKEPGRFTAPPAGKGVSSRGRLRQASSPTSSFSAQRLIWVDEMLTSGPTSFCSTSITLRVARLGHTSRPAPD